MRTTLASYLEDFLSRGNDTAYAHRHGLRLVRWSYGRVASTAYQFARELEARGVATGDRVVIWAGNSPEWIAAFLGCIARGAIAVPLDLKSAPGFVASVAGQVEAKLAVVDGATTGAAPLNLPEITVEDFGPLLSRHSTEPRLVDATAGDDTVEIVFTSGTTADPKGVCITHRNLLANLVPLEDEIGRYLKYERFVHPLRFLNLLPLSHVFGQIMGVFVPQLLGGEVFFQESLAPPRIMETIRRERISILIAVPRILEGLREKIERECEARGELDRFRRAIADARGRHPLRRWWAFRKIHSMLGWRFWAFISGGAPLAAGTEEFWDRLGFAVIQGYGMTETASLVSVNHPFKLARGSIGRAMPGQEVRLAADGEILVRGRNVSPGYWKSTEGIAASDDGWLHTGDVGALDAGGNLYFKGRKKEVIVTAAGMKIHPEDLEQAFDRQPEVKESVVVAADGLQGPEPLAVLILRRRDADAPAVIERANRALAEYQRIRRWYIWPDEDFPRTPTQKVRKGMVAARAAAALAGADHPGVHRAGAAAESGSIDGIILRIGMGMPETRDASATLGTDLNLDSLGRIELLGAIEDRYQIEIDEAAFTEETTIGEVERMIREGAREEAAPYPYPRWQQRAPVRWLRIALLHTLVLPATRVIGRPRIDGGERLRGVRGPLVFICNHVTMVDHALVLLAVPGRFKRTMAVAMDGEVLRGLRHPPPETGLLRRILGILECASVVFFFNVFSMPRKSGFRRSFAFAGEMIDRGCSVLVFPEGQYTKTGAMNRFMAGTGMLIAELGVPVVPLRIDGLWELKQAGRRHGRPGEISVFIGEPVTYSAHDAPERIATDLEERLRRLK